jgi:arylsulfatase A-like enzyme
MITRRDFLKTSMTGLMSTLLPLSVFNSCAKIQKQPNVLFIIADDMNDYGFYDVYPGVKMPYLEKFKKNALTFEKAYCAAPACVPSRAAVFSGMFPHKTGAYLNGSDPWNKAPFTEIEAMPECFKRNGYTTFGRGKLFHSKPAPERREAMWDNEVWGDRFDICGNSDPKAWRKFVHAYCACTTFADWSAGRVLESLENSTYADNTIVIFWSDNGYHCGEKNHWEKSTLWEQAALTPMAIRIPDMKTAGQVCKIPVNSLDFYPTLIDYCKLNTPEHYLDGESLRPLFNNPGKIREKPSITTYGEGFYSARDKQYRYIQYPDGTEELFDHETDPYEFTNLIGNPERESEKNRLLQWKPRTWAKSFGGRLG